jgi:hypothetical protein
MKRLRLISRIFKKKKLKILSYINKSIKNKIGLKLVMMKKKLILNLVFNLILKLIKLVLIKRITINLEINLKIKLEIKLVINIMIRKIKKEKEICL